jgi:hypothetical protein
VLKFLANYGGDVAASADDLARFGPQAAQVRALLNFLPTMSDDAVKVSDAAVWPSWGTPGARVFNADWEAAANAASRALPSVDTWNDVAQAASDAVRGPSWEDALDAAASAAGGVAAGDFITPKNYRILTNPIAAGRAVDVLGSKARNQGTPFLDVVKTMAERRVIISPRDIVVASRLAKAPEDIREIALTLMSDGMSAEEAMRTARML